MTRKVDVVTGTCIGIAAGNDACLRPCGIAPCVVYRPLFPIDEDLLVESPLFRYECCEHCRTALCPRYDGHASMCESPGCVDGTEMLGEPRPTSPTA